MEWAEVADLLTGAGMAHLATASRDGRPHVSAVMPAVEGEALWIATNASSGKARNLRENPRVALMWQPRAEIYLFGRAEVASDSDERQRLSSGLFPFDLGAFFTAADLVFVRVEPESAIVLTQGPEGLAQQRWRHP